jgi:hypothetical protein
MNPDQSATLASPASATPTPLDFGHIRSVLGKRERERRASARRERPRPANSHALLHAALAAVATATGVSVRVGDCPSPRALAARVARAVVLAVERGPRPAELAFGDEHAVHCKLATRAALRERALGRSASPVERDAAAERP